MRRIALVLVLLLAACQPKPTDPATYPQNLTPRNAGSAVPVIVPASYPPIRQPNDPTTAAFRTSCRISHASYADPIVAPGGSVSHLHSFYGNTNTYRGSTPDSIRLTGRSTCAGGTANRTAYWVPSIIDTTGPQPWPVVPHGPVCPPDEQYTPCAQDRSEAMQVYYKSGYDGVAAEDIVNFPVGLRMIAGDVAATAPQRTQVMSWHCAVGPGSDVGISRYGPTMPTCPPGQLLVMEIRFPQCWDGINLDSPDHRSHMAYGAGWPDKGCPPSHPVALPQITENVRHRVPAEGMDGWALSSDMGRTPGLSAHGDWMNGWDPAVFQRIIDNCFHVPSSGARDCRTNLLGDGYALG